MSTDNSSNRGGVVVPLNPNPCHPSTRRAPYSPAGKAIESAWAKVDQPDFAAGTPTGGDGDDTPPGGLAA